MFKSVKKCKELFKPVSKYRISYLVFRILQGNLSASSKKQTQFTSYCVLRDVYCENKFTKQTQSPVVGGKS